MPVNGGLLRERKPTFAFDAWTTAAVADELRARCAGGSREISEGVSRGGRVQEVVQVDEWTYALEIYSQHRRHYLVLSAHPQWSRAHLVSQKPRRGVSTPSPLLLLLRKWVRGAHLDRVEQAPFERVLTLTFDHPKTGESRLVGELMGRHGNVLLLDAGGRILQAVKVVGPDRNPVRTTRPGDPYRPPPPQAKVSPLTVSPEHLLGWSKATPGHHPLWRVLVSKVAGVSPLLAREMVHRAFGTPQAVAGDMDAGRAQQLRDVFSQFLNLLATAAWEPTVVREGEVVLAFAPYPLTHLGTPARVDSISRAVEMWLEAAGQADPYAGQRARVAALLEEARARVRHRVEALERQLAEAEDPERWRVMGDWLLAYASQVPAGQSEVVLETDAGPLKVQLEPDLSAVENAQRYYQRYQKARRAQEEVPALLAEAEAEAAYLEQLATDLALARDASEVGEVERALVGAGYVPRGRPREAGSTALQGGRRVQAPPARPLKFTTSEGFTVLVGRSARLNDEVTFRRAAPDDLWFHARNVPGAHVVLRSGGQPVSEETMRRVAALAAHYSAAGGDAQVEVQVTRVRDVRRHPSGRPGQVLLRREEVMRVAPQPWEG